MKKIPTPDNHDLPYVLLFDGKHCWDIWGISITPHATCRSIVVSLFLLFRKDLLDPGPVWVANPKKTYLEKCTWNRYITCTMQSRGIVHPHFAKITNCI